MSELKGFWSYVYDDDVIEGQRITKLGKDIVNHYRLLTGDTIQLFLDKDSIEWGDKWRDEIDKSLSNVAFFIPVLTPQYLLRPECIREFKYFIKRTEESGLKELILPLHYVDIPELSDEKSENELIKLIKATQWEDWREIRFMSLDSEGYRRAVDKLAKKLVAINKELENSGTNLLVNSELEADEEEDNSLGIVDKLAEFEDKLFEMPKITDQISENIGIVGQIMTDAINPIKNEKSFRNRQSLTRKIAHDLNEPTNNIFNLSNQLSSSTQDVDVGYRIIIEQAPLNIEADPESRDDFCQLFKSVKSLAEASLLSINSAKEMLEALTSLENMSRDLRPVVKRLKQGITVFTDTAKVYETWLKMIEETGIEL